MISKCSKTPKVLGSNGEIVDSRLFNDLLTFSNNNRNLASELYLKTKNERFINDWMPRLILDEYGEPTLASLLSLTNLNTYISNDDILTNLNREIGHFKRDGRIRLYPNTNNSVRELRLKAILFNTTNPLRDLYVARLEKVANSEDGNIYASIVVRNRNEAYSIEDALMQSNEALNNRLTDILALNGVSIGALTELEERRGINGVTDFSQAKDAATGIIELIRIAQGLRGLNALPEEFAHFAIESLINEPLVLRLINNLYKNNLAPTILGDTYADYNILYNGDNYRLAKEAAGKLVANLLLELNNAPKVLPSLLQRVINRIRDFFSNWNSTLFERAIIETDNLSSLLASLILTGSMNDRYNLESITETESFYLLNNRVERDRKILSNIIDREATRVKIYSLRTTNPDFTNELYELINRLLLELENNNEIEGIYLFVENALDILTQLDKRLMSLDDSPRNVKEKASVLRDIRNYMYSYSGVMDLIRRGLVLEELQPDNRYEIRIRNILDLTQSKLNDLFAYYNEVAMPLFVDFIKPYIGESIEVPFGKYKGQVMTAETLIQMADRDITFFDRWLDSMADSSDLLNRIFDLAVKQTKERSRLRTIEVLKLLQAAHLELESAGIRDTLFMFERDNEGNFTGNYVTEVNEGLFKLEYKKFEAYLNDKYGENPIGDDYLRVKEEKSKWFLENTILVDNQRIPNNKYVNPLYKALNTALRKYYETVMRIKELLDSYLPPTYTNLNNAVLIRRDLVERIKHSTSIGEGTSLLWENIKDNFIRRTDDTDFGDRAALIDFEGRLVQRLPIYFTRRLENPNEISTDVTSTLVAYASMANDYNQMNKVIDILELGRDLLREREITLNQGGRPLVLRFTEAGRKVENTLTRLGDKTRFIQRLDDFFRMLIYGEYQMDEGTFGKTNIDKAKVANFVNKLTSLNSMAFNILLGISNVATGTVMMNTEAIAGEFFNKTDVLVGDKNYWIAMPLFLANLGNRVKNDKLSLFSELFNTMLEHELSVRDINMERKSIASRLLSTNSLFFLSNAGEHYMLNRTALALANSYKLKDSRGKEYSLWDSLEVVPIDPNNRSRGGRLLVKQGFTKLDNTPFTELDIVDFSRKSAAINQRMHGIYNKLDRNAWLSRAIGRLGMMFRKWMKPSLNRRFKGALYNYDLKEWTEGFYTTSGRFMNTLFLDLRLGLFDIAANWLLLTKVEKANVKRAISEVAHFVTILTLIGLIEGLDDDDDRPWLLSMAEYLLRRLSNEIGVFVPGPLMLNEGLKILKSPAAGINTIDNLLDLLNMFNPLDYFEEVLLGRYKGHSKNYKRFFESPIVPFNRTIYKGLHPEESILFYKGGAFW